MIKTENKKIGKQSFRLKQPPVITAWASVAGKKESEGPLAQHFDITNPDSYFGQKTWEQAERKMQQNAFKNGINISALIFKKFLATIFIISIKYIYKKYFY